MLAPKEEPLRSIESCPDDVMGHNLEKLSDCGGVWGAMPSSTELSKCNRLPRYPRFVKIKK